MLIINYNSDTALDKIIKNKDNTKILLSSTTGQPKVSRISPV